MRLSNRKYLGTALTGLMPKIAQQQRLSVLIIFVVNKYPRSCVTNCNRMTKTSRP